VREGSFFWFGVGSGVPPGGAWVVLGSVKCGELHAVLHAVVKKCVDYQVFKCCLLHG
jgi:hypothetical protein